ncbi:MAG: dsRBD fold-containing protein [Nocardioides sp.]|uniref:dsRBD fold-containing protein n=1 Tax=Nocardioides sp. TaxID=35761 RepID=UPI003264512C
MSHPTATTWWVEVFLGASDGIATAHAKLHNHEHTNVGTTGEARVDSQDPDVLGVGYELATARALMALAQQLLESAAGDIGGSTGESVPAADFLPGPRPAPDTTQRHQDAATWWSAF